VVVAGLLDVPAARAQAVTEPGGAVCQRRVAAAREQVARALEAHEAGRKRTNRNVAKRGEFGIPPRGFVQSSALVERAGQAEQHLRPRRAGGVSQQLLVTADGGRVVLPGELLSLDLPNLRRALGEEQVRRSGTRTIEDGLAGFGSGDLDHRLLRGGLPEQLLAPSVEPEWYSEWLDSFYARDIQELFGIRERTGFLNLLRLMLRQSSGLADYSALARECDVSRPTVKAHLEALSVALAIVPVAPFSGGSRRELVRRTKIYGFDTGFVAFVRGWTDLRDEDRGPLWEHLVLDVLRASPYGRSVSYWRDKSDHEVDFVIPRGRQVDAVECKIRPERVDAKSLAAFRRLYPEGRNVVVSPHVDRPYDFRVGPLKVRAVGCAVLLAAER